METILGVLCLILFIGLGVYQFMNADRISLEWYFSERGGLGVRIMASLLIAMGVAVAAISFGLL